MHELQFCDALRPAPVVVLNLPLADYSLGHEVSLLRRRNPLLVSSPADFALLDPSLQKRALREAIWLCSDPAGERARFERELSTTWFHLRYRWNDFKRRQWGRNLKKRYAHNPDLETADYNLAHVEFRNYLIESHRTLPGPNERASEICAEQGGYTPQSQMHGRAGGSPFIARLLAFALQEDMARKLSTLNPKPSTLFDLPYSLVANLYIIRGESEGRLWIENQEEADYLIESAQKLAAFRARQAKKSEISGQKSEVHPTSDLRFPSSAQTGLATALQPELMPSTLNPQPSTD